MVDRDVPDDEHPGLGSVAEVDHPWRRLLGGGPQALREHPYAGREQALGLLFGNFIVGNIHAVKNRHATTPLTSSCVSPTHPQRSSGTSAQSLYAPSSGCASSSCQPACKIACAPVSAATSRSKSATPSLSCLRKVIRQFTSSALSWGSR